MKTVAMMLKAIHAQESKQAARDKAIQVIKQLKELKLSEAAKKPEDGLEETLTYMDFPTQHRTRIRTNNTIERLKLNLRKIIDTTIKTADCPIASLCGCRTTYDL